MLKVECESCKAPYQVDERRVPPTGLKMRCPKCGHTFLVSDPSKGAAPAAPGAAPKPPLVKKPTMVGVGFAPPGAVTPPPPVAAAPAPPPFDDGLALPAVVNRKAPPVPVRPPPVAAAPAPAPAPFSDLGDLDLPALADDVGLPAAVVRPAKAPPVPAMPAPPAAKPFSFEIDMPGPGQDLPSPKHTLDLPMTKQGNAFGGIDLPMTKGGDAGFGSIDLPSTKVGGGFADLPSPQNNLPSFGGGGGGGFGDLPSVQNNLPSFGGGGGGGGFGDLPSVQNSLPSLGGGGLPMAKGGGFGEIDLPSLQNDLPNPMGEGAHLPQAMGAQAQLPMPVSDDRLLPNRPGAPPSMSFGELDLPLVGSGTGLPVPLTHTAAPNQVSFGELDLPADPSMGQGHAPPQGGGMGFGEVDLGGDPMGDNGPALGPPPAATGGGFDFQEASIEPAGQAQQRRARQQPQQNDRAPSKAPKIIAAVAAIVVIGGAALEMTPLGAFGRIKISDMLHTSDYAAQAVTAGDDTRKKLAPDTYQVATQAADDLVELRRKTPRSRPLSAYAAFVEYAAEARFGANPDRAARVKTFTDVPPGTPVAYLAAALAAAQAASGEWQSAKDGLAAAATTEPKDGIQQEIALLRGEVALNLKDWAGAAAFFGDAQKMASTPRASFGLARAYYGARNNAKAKEAVDATLKDSPNHAGAHTMRGILVWELQRDDVAAMKEIEPLLDPKARTTEGPSEVSFALAAKGWIMLARERASEARAAFDEAVKIDPRNVSALIGQGEVLYNDTRNSEAMNRFSEAVKKDPTNLQAIVGESKTKIALERLADAKTQLSAAKKMAPKDLLVTLWLARTEQALGNKNDAEKLYQNAIDLADPSNPDAVQAYASYAIFLASQGRTADAQAKLDLAKSKLADSATLQRAFGDVASAQGSWDDAVSHYQQALAKNPNDLGTRFHLGQAFRKMKRIDDAAREFDKIGVVEKDFPQLAVERGLIFEQTGDTKKALEQFKSALQKTPNDDDLKVRVGAALVAIGQPDEALPILKGVMERRPQSAEIHHFLGRALLLKGGSDSAAAMRDLQRAVELDPNRADYHVYVARAATESSPINLGLARQEVDKALANDKTLAEAYWQRGVVERAESRPGDAVKDLKKALELKPTLFQAHAALAQALSDKNDTAGAMAEWAKVFTQEDKNPSYNYAYGRLLLDKGASGDAAKKLNFAVDEGKKAQPRPGWLFQAAFEAGEASRKSGDKARAIEMYRLYLEMAPPTSADVRDAQKRLTEWKEPFSLAP